MRKGKLFMCLPGLALVLLLAGCAIVPGGASAPGVEGAAPLDSNLYREQQPIPPIPWHRVEIFDSSTKGMKQVYWASLTPDQVRKELPMHTDTVSVSTTDVGGSIKYLPVAISAKNSNYTVTLDFIKSRVEYIKNKDFQGWGHVGVGLRVKAVVYTTEAGLDLGSLLGLSMAANAKTLRGTLMVQAIGIDSASVSDLMPITANIDQSSIQATMQALAAVKSKIWEPKTTVTPHLVSIAQDEPNKIEQFKSALKSINQ